MQTQSVSIPSCADEKVKKAATDSEIGIKFDKNRKGLYNLLTIYKMFSLKSEKDIENEFAGKGYGDFKKALAEEIIENISPIREKIQEILKDKKYLDKILEDGAIYARKIAEKKVEEVKKKMGLI